MIAPRELLTGICSMLAGMMITYSLSAVKLEARVNAIEKGVARIEARMDRIGVKDAK